MSDELVSFLTGSSRPQFVRCVPLPAEPAGVGARREAVEGWLAERVGVIAPD